jgi:heterodisulfide reductase subunit B
MTGIGYFPGCSLEGSAAEYDRSLRALAAKLGAELREVPEWVCCGASSAHALDGDAALALAAANLGSASRADMDEVLAPCAMCFQRLATAAHELARHPALARELADAMAQPEEAPLTRVRVVSVLRWLGDVPPQDLAAKVVKPLAGLKVACYYGCLLTRPAAVTGCADPEAPRDMEKLVAAVGGEPVRWPMALECCGGSFAVSRKEVVLRQAQALVASARRTAADVICVACPMCHANLDLRQRELVGPEGAPLPVVYLTQLLGLALGVPGEALGFDAHFVPVAPVVAAALARAPHEERRGPPCRG